MLEEFCNASTFMNSPVHYVHIYYLAPLPNCITSHPSTRKSVIIMFALFYPILGQLISILRNCHIHNTMLY